MRELDQIQKEDFRIKLRSTYRGVFKSIVLSIILIILISIVSSFIEIPSNVIAPLRTIVLGILGTFVLYKYLRKAFLRYPRCNRLFDKYNVFTTKCSFCGFNPES